MDDCRRLRQVHGRRERDACSPPAPATCRRQRSQAVEHRRQGRARAGARDDGPGGSFGLPEGLSIPVTAKHKAAAAAFIEWWERPENAIAIYKTQGSLPCGATALKQLADSGELQGGDVVSAELPHVGPLFPGGAPIWYSQFSSDAQGLLNAAVKGDKSVADALNELSDKAKSHNS